MHEHDFCIAYEQRHDDVCRGAHVVVSWNVLLFHAKNFPRGNETNFDFNFSDGDQRLRWVRRSLLDVLLQRRQVRLRHSGHRGHVRPRIRKVFEERHGAEAAAAASAAVPSGGH